MRSVATCGASLAALVLLALCYSHSLAEYARNNFYQEHFVYLWLFFAIAIVRAGRGPVASRFELRDARTAWAFAALLATLSIYRLSQITGSTTAQRLSLVGAFGTWTLLALPHWSMARCAGYVAFATLCFGIPFSAYFEVSTYFRHSFMWLLDGASRLFGLGFAVNDLALEYPTFRLDITPDCSGFNQLVVFFGLAFLGSLTGRPSARRSVLLFVLAIVIAYVSNVARILTFAVLLSHGLHQFVESPTLHAITGLIVYAPFILAFVWVVIRTHRPRPVSIPPPLKSRGVPIVALVLPLACLWAIDRQQQIDLTPPAYLRGIEAPPGYRLVSHAGSEEREKEHYETPHLVNAQFAHEGDVQSSLQIFAYLTRTRGQLAVHQLAQCLNLPGHRLRYGPSIEVEGRRFWTVELVSDTDRYHGYFSFYVDGKDLDDSFGTMFEVFCKRAFGKVREVGLTRLILDGPLELPVTERDQKLLEWRAHQLNDLVDP